VAAELLQGAAEAEVRVVVRRRGARERVELVGRFVVALAVEQRAAQRLADRGLVRFELAGLAQRDGGGGEVALSNRALPRWKSS